MTHEHTKEQCAMSGCSKQRFFVDAYGIWVFRVRCGIAEAYCPSQQEWVPTPELFSLWRSTTLLHEISKDDAFFLIDASGGIADKTASNTTNAATKGV